MKALTLWALLAMSLVPLAGCHWHHRHHHDGYYSGAYGENYVQRDSRDYVRHAVN